MNNNNQVMNNGQGINNQPVTNQPTMTQPVVNQPTMTQPVVNQPVANNNTDFVTEKKSKKGLIILLVIVLLIIALGVVGHFVIFSPERLAKGTINTSFENMKVAVKDYYKNNMKYDLEKEALGISGNVIFDSNYNKNGVNLTNLKNYTINYNFVIDKPNNKASYGVNVKRINKDFLNIKSLINGKTAIIDFGDMFNRTYKTNIDSEIKDIDIGNTASEKDIITLLDRTKEFALNHVSKDKVTKSIGNYELNGKKKLLTKIVYEVDLDKYQNDLIDFYSDDKQSLEALSNITGLSEKEIKDQIKNETSGLEADNESKETVNINNYYKIIPIKADYIELVNEKEKENLLFELLKDKVNFIGKNDNKEVMNGSYDYDDSKLLFDFKDGETAMNVDFTFKDNTINGSFKIDDSGSIYNMTLDSKTEYRKNNDSKTITNVSLNVQSDEISFNLNVKANTDIKTKANVNVVNEKNSYTDGTLSESESNVLTQNMASKLMTFINDVYPQFSTSFRLGNYF